MLAHLLKTSAELSSDPLTITPASGVTLNDSTASECPFHVRMHSPERTSHILTHSTQNETHEQISPLQHTPASRESMTNERTGLAALHVCVATHLMVLSTELEKM